MYHREKSLVMSCSASAVGNNLSVNVIESRSVVHYAVVSGHTVNLISAALDGHSMNQREIICKDPNSVYPSNIIQAKLIPCATKLLLVLCNENGIQISDAESGLFLFYHRLSGKPEFESELSSRGVCCLDLQTLCCGTSSGEILVFKVPRQRETFKLTNTLSVSKDAIWDVISYKGKVFCGTDSGEIVVLKSSDVNSLEIFFKISGSGYPCTSLACHGNSIVGAYGSGHICLYDIEKGHLTCEVTAHARWIHSIDVSQDDGHVLMSAGEDTFVRMWRFNEDSSQVQHLTNIQVDDVLIQGSKFVGSSSTFALTGYDYNEIFVYNKD